MPNNLQAHQLIAFAIKSNNKTDVFISDNLFLNCDFWQILLRMKEKNILHIWGKMCFIVLTEDNA